MMRMKPAISQARERSTGARGGSAMFLWRLCYLNRRASVESACIVTLSFRTRAARAGKDGEGRSRSAIRPVEGQHFVQRFHEVLAQGRRIELPVLADHQLLAAEFPLELRDSVQGSVVPLGGATCDSAKIEPLRARVTGPAKQ